MHFMLSKCRHPLGPKRGLAKATPPLQSQLVHEAWPHSQAREYEPVAVLRELSALPGDAWSNGVQMT